MEALRRGASLAQQQAPAAEGSRHMSTVTTMTTGATSTKFSSQPPPPPPRIPSPTLMPEAPRLAPTGLPFYTHTEPQTSAGLPAVPPTKVQYFRYTYSTPNAPEEVDLAIARMVSNLSPPPGSRWQGVVGFDMEWTVPVTKGKTKTGLIQISDETSILLVQISSMKYFPSKLKALITSPTILKVGVNISGDMRRLCQEFGVEHAGRGIVDLSFLAKVVDVGLIGTKVADLDSDRASIGIGVVPKGGDQIPTNSGDALESDNDSEKEIDILGGTGDGETERAGSKSRATAPVNKVVRPGRVLIQLARLVRRYLGRELEKGEERMSNWDVLLSKLQRRYAANDVHAGLALYHALRSVHARSIAEGVIPVPAPPPWETPSSSTTSSLTSPTTPQVPAPPPFRPEPTTTPATKPEPQPVPVDQLQNLTPGQLDSLLPWSILVYDLRAEMDDARAAVTARRIKEGVDVNGKGEAVVAAEAAAKAAVKSSIPASPAATGKDTPTESIVATSSTHTDTPPSSTLAKDSSPADPPLADNYYGIIPSKGMTRVHERHRAAEQKNEVMGKKWPPTRVTAPRPAPPASSSSSAPTTKSRPASPSSSTTIPTKPSSSQLRAYLLWHNRKLTLPQICAMMRSERAPLAKHTVM
ncbi:hypothetical protein FRC10_003785 [Ceratobasidium sp. 414]|nr:hypothetical protein FRC10_003785 [Ceratobasidium sp. 414]